ncbi:MAG: DUF1343 domain-containing protein, partial [Saprospiraceae bacterium]|nr:DUF1343 domain-containing protein [Saprospiraceae bacterium]
MTQTGLDRLIHDTALQRRLSGNIAYLCHNASVDQRCREGLGLLRQIFGPRLKAVFSPQHGLFSEAQDNMIESDHFLHPYYRLPVYSLYSETRSPTPDMLRGIDQVIVDLQDIGSRPYTFTFTMLLLLEACGKAGIRVTVLDRPNPLSGQTVEGNLLEPAFRSFIGLYPLPMRHGLTIGEIARLAVRHWQLDGELEVIAMANWRRSMYFGETQLPWVFPSPNMPHIKTAQVFPATVLLEGTSLSEGRGSTRPFELFGHPALQPHDCLKRLEQAFASAGLQGFSLRPMYFQPTFDKFSGHNCGAFQLHVHERRRFQPWRTGLVLLRELFRWLGPDFQWRQPPFEYEEHILPIDLLTGTDRLRLWVEKQGAVEELDQLEAEGLDHYLSQRENILLYRDDENQRGSLG